MDSYMKEPYFISDQLDKKGLRENDSIHIYPISGRKSSFSFKFKTIEFMSENYALTRKNAWVKYLPSLKNEKFHIAFKRVTTLGKRNEHKERILCHSIDGFPFLINGVLSQSAFVEVEDILNIGHNTLTFSSKDNSQTKISYPIEKKILESSLLILIEGETGTGKTKLAREIHEHSGRSGDFIHLNLASYSKDLLESELFGHVKGAFTGAYNDKKGAFEEASFGTLFLDEIDSLSLEMQTKLLLFFDNMTYRSVGSTREKKSNARIIVASGKKLETLVNKDLMRKDFFFRLSSSYHIRLKPLREDLSVIDKFCYTFSLEENCVLSPKLIEFYKTLPWAGNFRQLKNHLLKKKVCSPNRKLEFDKIDEELLLKSTDLYSFSSFEESYLTMSELKAAYAVSIYNKLKNNLSESAKVLELSPRVLKRLLAAS